MSVQPRTLLVDAGNSRLKWGIAQGNEIIEPGAVVWEKPGLAQLLTANWQSFAVSEHLPTRIVLANVAGEDVTHAVEQWVAEQQAIHGIKLPLDCVKPQARAYGVESSYAEPEKLGVDRWLGLVAAHHFVHGAACVIDCGTALTVDVISAQGVHQGGIIVPGMKLMKHSLVENTDAIQHGQSQPAGLLGNDTQSALQGGALAASSGAILQVMQDASRQLGEPLSAIITGGDAPQLLSVLGEGYRHEPHWVLKGLAVIAADT